jgi:DDE superfamily endonuclease
VGQRLRIPYEAPQGRRVNVIGAYFTHGPSAGEFRFESYATLPKSRAKKRRVSLEEQAVQHGVLPEAVGPIDSERFLAFVWQVAGRPTEAGSGWERARPLVIVLDNYSVHVSERVRTEQAALVHAGVILWYLPAYSPEMSAIEPIWQSLKHHEIPQRSFEQVGELKQTVDGALEQKAVALRARYREAAQSLRRAA